MQQHPCHHQAKALGGEVAMAKVGSLPVIAHTYTQTHSFTEDMLSLSCLGFAWMRVFQLHFYPSSCIFCLLLVCTNKVCLQGNGPSQAHLSTAWLLSLPWAGNKVGTFGDAEYQYYCTTSDTGASLCRGLVSSAACSWGAIALCTCTSE